MKKGDTAQFAIWYCDEDDPLKMGWWKAEGCYEHMDEAAALSGVRLGGLKWYELAPGEKNAGFPPKGRAGTNFKLLVAEADVVGYRAVSAPETFIQDLSMEDLDTLRGVTRKAYAFAHPQAKVPLTDSACDEAINELGPDTVEKLLMEAVYATKH